MARTLITGASSGIGRAAALALAKQGHALGLVARRASLLEELASECSAAGSPKVILLVGDVTDDTLSERIPRAYEDLGSGEAALVNNAGAGVFRPVAQSTEADLLDQLRVNLEGAIRCTHAALPAIKATGGQIVNVVSMLATHTMPGCAAYCASKAGLLAFMKCLMQEERRNGVRITNLLPGAVDTPIWDGSSVDRADMIPAAAVAQTIVDCLAAPRDRSFDEILMMPVKGIL